MALGSLATKAKREKISLTRNPYSSQIKNTLVVRRDNCQKRNSLWELQEALTNATDKVPNEAHSNAVHSGYNIRRLNVFKLPITIREQI